MRALHTRKLLPRGEREALFIARDRETERACPKFNLCRENRVTRSLARSISHTTDERGHTFSETETTLHKGAHTAFTIFPTFTHDSRDTSHRGNAARGELTIMGCVWSHQERAHESGYTLPYGFIRYMPIFLPRTHHTPHTPKSTHTHARIHTYTRTRTDTVHARPQPTRGPPELLQPSPRLPSAASGSAGSLRHS